MKATGIVRRIDDLGRIVIPKEIRRTMRIREGDPLEIYTESDGTVIFKKYSPIADITTFAGDICASLYSACGFFCAICDSDTVLAYSGNGKKDVLEKNISPELEELLESRKCYIAENNDVRLTSDKSSPSVVCACPVTVSGDVIGIITFIETQGKKASDTESKLLSAAAAFLSRQLEA